MPKRKLLVTGGLGAVGSFLVKELRRRGHVVFVADHKHARDDHHARCDLRDVYRLT